MQNFNSENKNYRNLVDEAEGAYLKKDFLEAFLIQSCVIEGVLKNYALAKLKTKISQSDALKNRVENYEFARLADALFFADKIDHSLLKDLDSYRKQRNKVVHDLLKYDDKEVLDVELSRAYELGKNMKGFIVDDISRETQPGLTVAELTAQINSLLAAVASLQEKLIEASDAK